MTEHTPGPWQVGREWGLKVYTTEEPYAKPVCNPYIAFRTYSENEANARLIAAAPEMRAALKAVRDNGGFGFLGDEVQGQVIAALVKGE